MNTPSGSAELREDVERKTVTTEPSKGNRAKNNGHVQVAPRSTHTLTIRSLSIEPEAIIFCCGWVCEKMVLSTAVVMKLFECLLRQPQRYLRGPISTYQPLGEKALTSMTIKYLHNLSALQVPQVYLAVFATRHDPLAARDAEAGGDAVL